MAKIKINKTMDDRLHFFQNELTWLNMNILLLKKLRDFPWQPLRLDIMYRNFFNTTYKGLFEYSIVIVRRAYYDKRNDVITLKKFAEKIFSIFPNELEEIDTQLKNYEEKINQLRNNRFGHLNKSLFIDHIRFYNISFEEVRKISQLISKYFNIIGNKIDGRDIRTLPFEFDPEYSDEINEFDRLLNHIAKSSEQILLYEKNKELWIAQERLWEKNGNREKEIGVINNYRTVLYNLEEIK